MICLFKHLFVHSWPNARYFIKPYEFTCFGDINAPKDYKFSGFRGPHLNNEARRGSVA